jgi:hypothetical protein
MHRHPHTAKASPGKIFDMTRNTNDASKAPMPAPPPPHQTGHRAAPVRRGPFRADGVGRGDHAADKYALNETQDQEQHRRDESGLGDGRQQTEGRGADADADDGRKHRVLAAVNIGIMTEDRRTDRPHQQRHRE